MPRARQSSGLRTMREAARYHSPGQRRETRLPSEFSIAELGTVSGTCIPSGTLRLRHCGVQVATERGRRIAVAYGAGCEWGAPDPRRGPLASGIDAEWHDAPHFGRRSTGLGSTGCTPSAPAWCCCTAARPRAADARKVPQVAFKPDFARHRNTAPFKRNDRLLETMPIGAVVFPAPASPTTSPTRQELGIPILDYHRRSGT